MNKEETNTQASAASHASRVVIATTVALTFISFWRAGAVVLSDLASSMFYVGGIAERAVGLSAPWFIIGILLFSFAVRAVYIESCSMFVRGGVYVVVRDSMGPLVAKFSVSALIFDYLITGPISSVSAGHYIAGLINESYTLFQKMPVDQQVVNPNMVAVFFALCVTLYFWRSNIHGIHESSQKALRILQLTTVMVVVLLLWSLLTVLSKGNLHLPPAPIPSNLRFGDEALGWLAGTPIPQVAGVAMVVAFGHAFLSMSGFETLGQVYRELGHPKLKNLKITANLVCTYSVLSTGLITLFAAMIIPDAERNYYIDNLIGGLVTCLAGPNILRLVFHAFVVVVGAAILAGAVNTSIIGANAVLNRVAEDGVLLHWFRRPHRVYGTTSRIINIIAALQILTITWSGGDVYLLGEAYAFGVVWSFFLKSMGVLVLRYQRKDQEYKFPFNITINKIEIPIGLAATTVTLFLVAVANLLSKQIATIYGGLFTLVFFVIFTISERVNLRKFKTKDAHLEQFNVEQQLEISLESLGARPGSTLVAVRDVASLNHLQWALDTTKGRHRQIVVATIRPLSPAEGEHDLLTEQYFSSREQVLFSRVVEIAEKAGKHVDLLVIPAISPYDGIVQAAANLRCSLLVTGASPRMTNEELARRVGLAWERLPEPRHPFSLAIVSKRKEPLYVSLGPHSPRLWPEDIDVAHYLWLLLSGTKQLGSKLHHRDVVGFAIRKLQKDLESVQREELLAELQREISR